MQIVQLAMEAKDREREMTAKLLIALSDGIISTDQLALGFKRLLAFAEVTISPLSILAACVTTYGFLTSQCRLCMDLDYV